MVGELNVHPRLFLTTGGNVGSGDLLAGLSPGLGEGPCGQRVALPAICLGLCVQELLQLHPVLEFSWWYLVHEQFSCSFDGGGRAKSGMTCLPLCDFLPF